VIQYDPETNRVTVEPSLRISQGSENVIQEEQNHGRRDTVLVELDKAEDLKDAYPNYFLDVKMFTDLLRGAMDNKTADELERMIAPVAQTVTPTPTGIWNFGRWRRRAL
jgi:hypothetical protein